MIKEKYQKYVLIVVSWFIGIVSSKRVSLVFIDILK